MVKMWLADGKCIEFPEAAFPVRLEVVTTRGKKRYTLTLHYAGSAVKSVTLT